MVIAGILMIKSSYFISELEVIVLISTSRDLA